MRVLVAGAAVLTYAWWATGLRPFAAMSTIVVVSAGIAAMAFGSHRGPPRHTVRLRTSVAAAWVALLGALTAWQLAAYVEHPRSDHPTLSSLANVLLDTHPARVIAFVAWLAGAARLARR